MRSDAGITLLLRTGVDGLAWETAFEPFRFMWGETEPLYRGTLLQENRAIADVLFHPVEKRMELYPLEGQLQLCLDLLALPSFQALASNPVSTYATNQIRKMESLMPQLGHYEAMHDFRVALRKLRTILPHLLSSCSDSQQEKLSKRVKKIARLTGKIRDTEVQQQLLASYGVVVHSSGARQDMRKHTLYALLDSTVLADMQHAVDVSLYHCASLDPARMAAKRYGSLVKAVHAVRSARDIKAMHRVRKSVKALRYVRELAQIEQDPQLVALQDCLGSWHDMIMVQDQLQSQKKLSLDEKHSLVALQRDIDERLAEYRALTTPFWEERL
nr:CHAD domain-containing protein [uncultured Sphaerochaeta sp.]